MGMLADRPSSERTSAQLQQWNANCETQNVCKQNTVPAFSGFACEGAIAIAKQCVSRVDGVVASSEGLEVADVLEHFFCDKESSREITFHNA